jgi:DNA-directed RNA polymerase specialized sigma24 family protein
VGEVGVDDREFEEFFGAEFPAVVRSVLMVCQDLGWAEDLAQGAFLELLRHWGRVE